METKEKEATAPPERGALLTVATLAPEREFAEIDDVRYDFRMMQDMGAIEHQEFSHNTTRYDALWSKEHLNKAEKKQMEFLLDWLVDRALVDPAALRSDLGARLTGALKREIVLTFTKAPLLRMQLEAMAQQETEMETETEAQNSSTTES